MTVWRIAKRRLAKFRSRQKDGFEGNNLILMFFIAISQAIQVNLQVGDD